MFVASELYVIVKKNENHENVQLNIYKTFSYKNTYLI